MVIPRDLEVNRKLLDTKFQGYKLHSNPSPLYSLDISGVDVVPPSDEKYSFIQLREYSLHNHLHYDPWNTNSVYFINSSKEMVKIVFNSKLDSCLEGPHTVWTVPSPPGDRQTFNITLEFASQDLAVLHDGSRSLYILSTGDRSLDTQLWKTSCVDQLEERSGETQRLRDARLSADRAKLTVLLSRVDTKLTHISSEEFLIDERGDWRRAKEKERSPGGGGGEWFSGKGSVDLVALSADSRSAVVIGQIDIRLSEQEGDCQSTDQSTLTQDERGDWRRAKEKERSPGGGGGEWFSGKGSVDLVALSADSRSAVVIGQIDIRLSEQEGDCQSTDQSTLTQDSEPRVDYEWQQNFEEIKVWLKWTGEGSPQVTVTSSSVQVRRGADPRPLFQGLLYRTVEEGLSLWQIVQREGVRTLELVLSKTDEGGMWPQLFQSSQAVGREVPDSEVVAEIHRRLAHLTSDTEELGGGGTVLNSDGLEECDISDEEGRHFYRFSLSTSSPSIASTSLPVRVNVGNGQWLLSTTRSVCEPPAFVLRSDVDGLVYSLSGEGGPSHIATLLAFGFVQASKTSRLYSFCPQDSSYWGLVDGDGRVYIYQDGRRPPVDGGDLGKDWGRQEILYLPRSSRVLGVQASSTHLFLLTHSQIHLIQINL